MSGDDVIRAIENATAAMLLFQEQSKKEFGGLEEPLNTERLDQVITIFASACNILMPAGKKCIHCNGTGVAPSKPRVRKP